MSIDVYFDKDILRVCTALIVSTIQQDAGANNAEFIRGKLSSIQAVVLAFGGDFPELVKVARQNIEVGSLLMDAPRAVIESKKGEWE